MICGGASRIAVDDADFFFLLFGGNDVATCVSLCSVGTRDVEPPFMLCFFGEEDDDEASADEDDAEGERDEDEDEDEGARESTPDDSTLTASC